MEMVHKENMADGRIIITLVVFDKFNEVVNEFGYGSWDYFTEDAYG